MSNSSNSTSPPPDLTSPPPQTSPVMSPPPPDSSSSPPPLGSPPPPEVSPPPPSNDGNNTSPPPTESSPPPPSVNDNGPPPPSGNNNSPPTNNPSLPPPPPSSNNNNNNDSPSPPPPSRSGSSPRNESPQISNSPNINASSDNDNIIIIGVAAGAGLLLFIIICFLISCARRKKRKPNNHMNYYTDNYQHGNTADYYNPTQQSNWNNNISPPVDHIVNIVPPGINGQVSLEHNWAMGPPPPPPMMSSSDLSSANFSGPPPHPGVSLGFNQSTFTYDELSVATGGFSQSNLLGQGGFGYVHKGVLPNGKDIAVKSLKANSGQGEREFQAEVDIISRVHHRHLVSLVGYCIAGSQRLLVYEFVPNGTLEYHLHGSADRPAMDWPTRLRIAMGSAKGFAYLHEDCHPRIIHRDIKAANILLDENFDAKVADFGLAKLSSDNFTHVSTRIMGTFGYLAPEYASSGKLTEKSDVYSYGIMLLELITGQRPIDMSSDDDGLVDWARPILQQVTNGGSYEELVDPRLENNYNPQEMLRMVVSAAACIRHSARRRPKMSQIVRALEGDVSLDDLNAGIKATETSTFGSSGSSSYGDLARFRKAAGLSSQEFSTSGEQGATGEFITRPSDVNSSEIHSHPKY